MTTIDEDEDKDKDQDENNKDGEANIQYSDKPQVQEFGNLTLFEIDEVGLDDKIFSRKWFYDESHASRKISCKYSRSTIAIHLGSGLWLVLV